jgi:Raf kinase inhibitor-like YbhB/YbcL family protein
MADAALVIALVLAGCGGTPGTTQEDSTMQLTSSAFADDEPIPARHTCDGDDVSPQLAWDGAPDGTAAFVLVVQDPDAGDFVHWLLTDIPGNAAELAEGQGDAIGTAGPNGFGRTGWAGPCPPSGEHRYVFTLSALSGPLEIGSAADADAVRQAMSDRVLATATLSGVYERER